jgi:hypothetical protein
MTTKLRQTGNAPYLLDAQAKLLFDEDNGTSSGIGGKYWHWLRVFQAPDNSFVAAIEFRERDSDHCLVLRADDAQSIVASLQKYDTSKYVIGLPARSGEELTRDGGRNKVLLDDIKQRWEDLVSRTAKELGVVPQTQPKETTQSLQITLSQETLARIDAQRGAQSREDFVRQLIDAQLNA